MEARPYLSALYEATHVSQHPFGEAVSFRHLPLDVEVAILRHIFSLEWGRR
jgi:hypothetical protein